VNKNAQLGMTLMHIYALLFLVFVFIIFLAIFPVLKGKVGAVALQNGDLYAEHVLAKVMHDQALVKDEVMYLQDALNDPDLKDDAIDVMGKEVMNVLADMKISGWEISIAIPVEGESSEKKFYSNWLNVPSLTTSQNAAKGSLLQTSSLACWPVWDEGRISHVNMIIKPMDVWNINQFYRGNYQC